MGELTPGPDVLGISTRFTEDMIHETVPSRHLHGSGERPKYRHLYDFTCSPGTPTGKADVTTPVCDEEMPKDTANPQRLDDDPLHPEELCTCNLAGNYEIIPSPNYKHV